MDLRFFDAHNHLQDEWLVPHMDELLRDLPASGVAGMVVNGTSEEDWPRVSMLSQRVRWIIPSYGLHPWDCGNRSSGWLADLKRFLLEEPKAAVGEIGIDRWILDKAKPDDKRLSGLRRAPIEEQSEVFLQQLALAVQLARPASIHCLDAWGLLLELLQNARLPQRGFLLHAYGGPPEMVASFADLGAYFSFNGASLDPRRQKTHEAFLKVPDERLLMETDAPAMIIPDVWRSHALPPAAEGVPINHPANIGAVYRGYSSQFNYPLESLVSLCTENFHTLFAAD